MTTATAVLNAARSELGYREGSGNRTKFGEAYGLNYAPWCAMFLWKVARDASGRDDLIPRIAYTPAMARWFGERNALYGSPKRGDVAFFNFPDAVDRIQHVGLVEKVLSDGRIVTIEGNTSRGSGGSQSDGGGVYRRVRDTRYVVAYGRPAYSRERSAKPVSRSSRRVPLVVDGVWGPATTRRLREVLKIPAGTHIDPVLRRSLQKFLKVKADGIWGPVTRKALQKRVGVKEDGLWGPSTIRALQRLLNRS